MDYIDDEDDVIHIDSEHEFMEALKVSGYLFLISQVI